jgi:hypothetical protein
VTYDPDRIEEVFDTLAEARKFAEELLTWCPWTSNGPDAGERLLRILDGPNHPQDSS